MKYFISFILAILVVVHSQQLIYSRHLYFSSYSLGKQDQLITTFNSITQKIQQIPQIIYQLKVGYSYSIKNIKLKFTYDISQQNSIIQNLKNKVKIQGGYVIVDYNFVATKKILTQISGNASGSINSDTLSFTKQLIKNEQDFYTWSLDKNDNFNISNNMGIGKFDQNFTYQDKLIFEQLLNTNPSTGSYICARQQIINHVNKILKVYLQQSFDNSKFSYSKKQKYQYISSKGQIQQINWSYDQKSVNFNLTGISLIYQVSIDEPDFQYKFNFNVPTFPKQIDYYGGIQQFISFDLITNSIKLGTKKGWWNIVLNNAQWSTNTFQFFAGDLFVIIPVLKKQVLPTESLNGSCVQQGDMKVQMSGMTQLKINIGYRCLLGYNSKNILNFTITPDMIIQIQSLKSSLNFKVVNISNINFRYDIIIPYLIQNNDLAQFYVSEVVKNSIGSKVFGTGFKIQNRDYPNLQIFKDGYLLAYDSSHKPHQQ